jgi:sugar fermentation stimulation protein A|tara:strand:+ start:1911 stop:2618 length:708 start_codon:yes stop_codon:yes gene_type:complete
MSIYKDSFLTGKLIKRYKRFFADVQLDNGEIVTAHCPNTGSMMGLLDKGNKVFLSESDNKKRKLKYTLEIIKINGTHIGVNTHRANRIVEDAINKNKISSIKKNMNLKREVKYGENSRIDFFLSNLSGEEIYIEVKNVTLSLNKNLAEFPDAVTERGSKHLVELTKITKRKKRAIMLYLVQRDDCDKFKIANNIDPTYSANLKKAIKSGVEVFCYKCSFKKNNITLDKKIKFIDK